MAAEAEVRARLEYKEQARQNPIRLIYDNTKLKPWCVVKFDGEEYVQVTGWFAKEENARTVYNRLVKENPPAQYTSIPRFPSNKPDKWICPNCHAENSHSEICAYCGFDETINQTPSKKSDNSPWSSYINNL